MDMPRVSLDDFIEAFTAHLVLKGRRTLHLSGRDVAGLHRVHLYLDDTASEMTAASDASLRRSIVGIRNGFRPGAIGSFDHLNAILAAMPSLFSRRADGHREFGIELPMGSAAKLIESMPPHSADLAEESAIRFLSN